MEEQARVQREIEEQLRRRAMEQQIARALAEEKSWVEKCAERQRKIEREALDRLNKAEGLVERLRVIKDWTGESIDNGRDCLRDIKDAVTHMFDD